ncbi:hypothetical protein CDL15_Pgr015261 [Punica granatum]|uniref:Uncharacterized protein n=1 Tax=Punica granatum TaxID=22663 RepID=A0A218VZJ9_PUNGR|nr:hypothetical protein CDL15_Pgr015261 [Punica granatum]PKI52362.1 hypothetical protein CRG98_027288 [Punica granatum]
MTKNLLLLLLLILFPSKYESTSSPEPTTQNPHLVSGTRLCNEKERQTCKVSGKNHEGIQEVRLSDGYKKGKGVYGGGDLVRPRPGHRSCSSPHLMKSTFLSASLAPGLLALYFLRLLE